MLSCIANQYTPGNTVTYSSGPLSSDEKKNIKANKEKVTKLTISGEGESKKIIDDLKKSDTKGDTPTNKRRRGRISITGDLPKSQRNVQPDANKTVENRIKDAQGTAPNETFSTKDVSRRRNIKNPPGELNAITYDPKKEAEKLLTNKSRQSSNTYFDDIDDSTTVKRKLKGAGVEDQFTTSNEEKPKPKPSKATERPTKKPPTEKPSTKKPSTSSLPSQSKPKPSRKYTRAQKARLTGQANKILKQIKSAKKLETRMSSALDTSTNPRTYSGKVNRVINSKPLKGTPKPEVIKQADVSQELKKKSETAQQQRDKVQREKSRTKTKSTLKPTSTSGGSGSGKTAINNLTRKDPMPEVKSSGTSKRSGYSIKNDLDALKRKNKVSSTSTSTPPKTKPISGRIGFGASPGVDRITPPSTRRPLITPPPSSPPSGGGSKPPVDPPEDTTGTKDKKPKKKSWKKFRKNLTKTLFGKKGRKIPFTGGDLIYPGLTGYQAFSRQKQLGATNTRATSVGVARGGLDFASAAVAYRRMPGPAWLKSLAATGAVVASGRLGRSLENKLPLTKVEKEKVKNAENQKKEEEKLKNQRKNNNALIGFGGQEKVKAYKPNPAYVDFGFNVKGTTKRGSSAK